VSGGIKQLLAPLSPMSVARIDDRRPKSCLSMTILVDQLVPSKVVVVLINNPSVCKGFGEIRERHRREIR